MRNLTFIYSTMLSCSTMLVLALSACVSDDAGEGGSDEMAETETSGDGDGDTSTGDGDGETTTGDGESEDTTGESEDTTGEGEDTTTGDGDGEAGYCAQGCIEDADCCPFGSVNCPGDNYPDNYFCNDQGVCDFGGCSNDDDCKSGGLLENMECHPIAEQPTCFEPCANDDDCLLQPGTTCSGVADDGTKYCAGEPAPACQDDADCGGFGVCDVDSGECVCQQDSNCTAEGVDTCVLR